MAQGNEDIITKATRPLIVTIVILVWAYCTVKQIPISTSIQVTMGAIVVFYFGLRSVDKWIGKNGGGNSGSSQVKE